MIVERLKSLRKSRQVSQKDFAKALRVSQQTVASWEVGRTEPSNLALKDIADYFNVTTDYLLGLSDEPRPPDTAALVRAIGDCQKILSDALDVRP